MTNVNTAGESATIYERVTGNAAQPLYDALDQSREYNGSQLAEIRSNYSKTSITVHGQNNFTTLDIFCDGSTFLSIIANGVQTAHTLDTNGTLQTASRQWSPTRGLHGDATPSQPDNPASVVETITSMRTNATRQLDTLAKAKIIGENTGLCADNNYVSTPPAEKEARSIT